MPDANADADAGAGFAVVPHVLRREEIDGLSAAIDRAALPRTRAGARHVLRLPAVKAVAGDARLVEIARPFLGRAVVPFRATLFEKSARGNWLIPWHQDRTLPLCARRDIEGWGPWSVKGGINCAQAPARALERVVALRVHLDDSRIDNGSLRVLPGTHTLGLLGDEAIARISRESAAIDCLVEAGGVVAMRPLLLHASSKAVSAHPRRVLHIEYADTLEIEDGLRLAIA